MSKKFIYTLLFTTVLSGGSLLPIAAVASSDAGAGDDNFGTPAKQLNKSLVELPDTAKLTQQARAKHSGGLFSPASTDYYTALEVAALRGERDEKRHSLAKKLSEVSLDKELAGATRGLAAQHEQALEDIRRRLEGSRKQQAEIEAQMARLDEQVALKTREAQEAVAREEQLKQEALVAVAREEQLKQETLAAAEREEQLKQEALAAARREEQLKQETLAAVGAEKQLKEKALATAGAERELKEEALRKIAAEIELRRKAMEHGKQAVEKMSQTHERLMKELEELTQHNHSLRLKHGQVTEGHKALEVQNQELLRQFQSASAKKAQRGASSAVASDDDDDDGLAAIPTASFSNATKK